jgi:AcrR family transcriptional regulator
MQRDFPAVSVRRVAQDAATSTRAVYSLFGAKDGLLRALYIEGFDTLRLKTEAVPVTDNPLADVLELARAYRASAMHNRNLYGLMFDRLPGWTPSPADRSAARRTLRPLGAAVGRAPEKGLFGPDARSITLQLWALVHGLASLELAGDLGDDQRAAAHWEHAVTTGIQGYSTTPAASSSQTVHTR